jgi:hypothetical protein
VGITVGDETAWKVRRHGDIVVAFHWVGAGQDAEEEPAMVLYPAIPSKGAGCVIICLSAAYKYADSRTGEPTVYLLQRLTQFAKQMGMVITSSAMRKIADVVVDSLPDLLIMPPEPNAVAIERALKETGGVRLGEADIKVDGETIATVGM